MISNNNNMLSYIIRREERLALGDRSLTAEKECSWSEPTISDDEPLRFDEAKDCQFHNCGVNLQYWPCLKTTTCVSPISSAYAWSTYPASSAVGGVYKSTLEV